jgi:transposase
VAKFFGMNSDTLRKQYKYHLSDFLDWDQLDHCTDWILFPENIGSRISIDEVCLSNGELYTVVTNKAGKGRKGSLIAMVKGTKAADVSRILKRIPVQHRMTVTEVTLDMSNSMDWIVRQSFPNAMLVTDRFHVQQLVSDALQQIRIDERWKAIAAENEAVKECRKRKEQYIPETYENGDTKKQLLARSRYLLFKPQSKWTDSQKERAGILFREFPELETGYNISMQFRSVYEHAANRDAAISKLKAWYAAVEKHGFDSFITAMESIKMREGTILNFFCYRSTNASAESFNAKLKGFRSLVRGVTDLRFFIYRIKTFYA